MDVCLTDQICMRPLIERNGLGGFCFGKINGHRAYHGGYLDLCWYDPEGGTADGTQ